MNYTIHPIRERARHLRRNMTPEEHKLWQHLRARQLCGAKFRRQHPIPVGFMDEHQRYYYYADFYCHECRLVVELDGAVHADTEDYDLARDIRMLEAKHSVIRIDNDELNDMEAVLGKIAHAIKYIRSELRRRQKAAR